MKYQLNFLILFSAITLRYLAIAGFLYWICWKTPRFNHRRIDPKPLPPKWVTHDILWSIVTSVIFAAQGSFLVYAYENGWTLLYADPEKYGLGYLILSFPLSLFLHDTYFYWMHRFLHIPFWFRKVHYVHHRSLTPTPWAAFSFHPFESILESLIFFVLPFVMPCHLGVCVLFLFVSTVLSVINHTGYELYPSFTVHRVLLKDTITATHHFLHHRLQNTNYGLYFRYWDRWMKTESSNYETVFQTVTQSSEEPLFQTAANG